MLHQFGLYDNYDWMWTDFGILWGFYLFFCMCTFLALAFANFSVPRQEAQAKPSAPKQTEMSKVTERGVSINDDGDDEYRVRGHSHTIAVLRYSYSLYRHLSLSLSLSLLQGASETQPLVSSRSSEQTSGAYLSFNHLTYTVFGKRKLFGRCRGDAGEGDKQLLTDVCGYAKPGSMVALMGASGAGKTTLLDVLAGRKTGGRIVGEILLNGRPKDKFSKRMVRSQSFHYSLDQRARSPQRLID